MKLTLRRLILILTFGFLSVSVTPAFSQGNSGMPDPSELEAALEECAASLQSSGGGDMNAMEACMEEKGFSKPSGPRPSGGPGGNPPPRQ